MVATQIILLPPCNFLLSNNVLEEFLAKILLLVKSPNGIHLLQKYFLFNSPVEVRYMVFVCYLYINRQNDVLISPSHVIDDVWILECAELVSLGLQSD